MKCERIPLPYGGAGYVDTYLLDPEISYKTERYWPVMIICPGGGYLMTATKEGEGAAMQFLSHGFHCFVVRYSTYLKNRESLQDSEPDFNEQAHYPTQVLELMQVLHMIHEHAEEWHIDESRIFALGFSAGAHVVGSLATRWQEPDLLDRLNFVPTQNELKLSGALLCYPMLGEQIMDYAEQTIGQPDNLSCHVPVIKRCLYGTGDPTAEQQHSVNLVEHITDATCPMFIWHTLADQVTDPRETTQFVSKLQAKGIPCEYHLFQKGAHGLACANQYYAKSDKEVDEGIALWLPLARNWLKGFEL